MDIFGIIAFVFMAVIAFVLVKGISEVEKSVIPKQFANLAIIILMIVGFLGYFAYQFLSITYGENTKNGYITYNACDDWQYEGRDPDSGNEIYECYEYSPRISSIDEYIRQNIRGWLFPGVISGAVTSFVSIWAVNKMKGNRNDR